MTSNVHAIATELVSCGRSEVQRLERCCGAPRLEAGSGSRDSLSQPGQWWVKGEQGAAAGPSCVYPLAPSTDWRGFNPGAPEEPGPGIRLTRAALSERQRSSGCGPARAGPWGYQPTAPSPPEDPPSGRWDWRRPRTLRSRSQHEPESGKDQRSIFFYFYC